MAWAVSHMLWVTLFCNRPVVREQGGFFEDGGIVL